MKPQKAEGSAGPRDASEQIPAYSALGRADKSDTANSFTAQALPADPAEDDPTENSRWIVLEEMARIGYRIGALSQILIASAELGDCARAHDAFTDFVSCGAALRNADERLSRLLGLAGRK